MYKPDEKKDIFRQNLKLFCENNNYSYTDAAAYIGVSVQSIQSWIVGRSMPDTKCQELIEKAFGAKFDAICTNAMTLRLLKDHTMTIEDVFPYNCIIFVFNDSSRNCDELEEIDMTYKEITPNEFDDIFYKYLSYREQSVITLRFRDGLTLDKVSDRLGVGRERIRQIEAKAIRKMRRYFFVLLRDRRKKFEHLEILEAQNEDFRDYIRNMNGKAEFVEIPRKPTKIMNPDMTRSLESLELSVRAYNCLARAQLCTVKDIVEYDKPLIYIRNLGKASLEEIVKKIESLSIPYKFNYGDNSRDPNYYRFVKAEE